MVKIGSDDRRDVEGFMRRYSKEFVFVTDQPVEARCCFQIVDFSTRRTVVLQDLHAIPGLDIYETTVREYESLVRQIFPLVERGGAAADQALTGVRPTSRAA